MKEKIKKLPPPHVRRGALSLEEPFRLQVFVVEEGIIWAQSYSFSLIRPKLHVFFMDS